MPRLELKCEACGAIFFRYPSELRRHNFCGRNCARTFTSARMHDYNRNGNPMNTAEGWTPEKREAVRERERKNKGPCAPDTYPKEHGQHEHRAVAEKKMGRALRPGEVVHHINGDKHDNRPENLMIFSSQKKHVAYHAAHPEENGVYFGKRVI